MPQEAGHLVQFTYLHSMSVQSFACRSWRSHVQCADIYATCMRSLVHLLCLGYWNCSMVKGCARHPCA